ncbi:hypothetical protein RJT34_32003 [Clitoria ternatea]|uniref:Uncharacterized protein n=1 Tax=Clitoria ternatea TaxID=43366 RepID=A0AAN9EWK6_CLITE
MQYNVVALDTYIVTFALQIFTSLSPSSNLRHSASPNSTRTKSVSTAIIANATVTLLAPKPIYLFTTCFTVTFNSQELFVDNVDVGNVVFAVEAQDLRVELHGLGEIELVRVSGRSHEVAELPGETECTNEVLKEFSGAMEVGELGRFHGDKAVQVGEFGLEAAGGGLEGGEGGLEGGEGVVNVVEGGELGKKFVVAGEHFRAELVLKEADGMVELLGSGGRGTRGEGGEENDVEEKERERKAEKMGLEARESKAEDMEVGLLTVMVVTPSVTP